MASTKAIQAVKKAMTLLESLNTNSQGETFGELLVSTQLSRAALSRLLHTLRDENLVVYDDETKRYRLGIRLFEWGTTAAKGTGLREVALPYMKELVFETNETTHLGIMDQRDVIALAVAQSPSALRTVILRGDRSPFYCTGVGKALLAHLPEPQLMEKTAQIEFIRYTPNTITESSELLQHLEIVRENGYAVDNEEHFLGVTCVAIPIYDRAKSLRASLSVSGPSYRINDQGIESIVNALMKYGKQIQNSLPSDGAP